MLHFAFLGGIFFITFCDDSIKSFLIVYSWNCRLKFNIHYEFVTDFLKHHLGGGKAALVFFTR